METTENQMSAQEDTQEVVSSGVNFSPLPAPAKPKKGKGALILVILILVLVGGFFALRAGKDNVDETPTPTPTVTPVSPSPTPVASAEPVDKEEVSIEVQNGTGISGEAAYLQGQLRSLGYTDVTVANASSQDNTATTVTYSSKLSKTVQDEITKKLETIFQDVDVKSSASATKDVVIVTGLRKGATAKPSATATPKASTSPSPSASSSASPSASPAN